MSEEKPTIRGLEKFPKKGDDATDSLGGSAVSETVEIRGLEKFRRTEDKDSPQLIPGGYDMAPEVGEKVKFYEDSPDFTTFEDPKGILAPGVVLDSPHDPKHRRLITNLVRNFRGHEMVMIHIEGGKQLFKYNPESIYEKIADGDLLLPNSETTK